SAVPPTKNAPPPSTTNGTRPFTSATGKPRPSSSTVNAITAYQSRKGWRLLRRCRGRVLSPGCCGSRMRTTGSSNPPTPSNGSPKSSDGSTSTSGNLFQHRHQLQLLRGFLIFVVMMRTLKSRRGECRGWFCRY
ncbi:hypothetical protein HK102_011822, partial [Quaeritorhiza haematococci]